MISEEPQRNTGMPLDQHGSGGFVISKSRERTNMEIHPAEALAAVLAFGGPERTYRIPQNAVIRLAEGTGHLLTGATITAWGDE